MKNTVYDRLEAPLFTMPYPVAGTLSRICRKHGTIDFADEAKDKHRHRSSRVLQRVCGQLQGLGGTFTEHLRVLAYN